MVDEAHGAGVLGARGAGASELLGVEADVDLRMGTFSKSLASCGGFIAGSHEVIDFLRISSSRAFLFTAAAVPAAVGAAPGGAADHPLGRRAGSCSPACWTTPQYLSGGLALSSASSVRSDGEPRRSRRSSPCWSSDDWKAVLLWRALYDAGGLRQRGDPPGRPARRRAAAHERHGDPRPGRPGPGLGCIRKTANKRSNPMHGPLPEPVAKLISPERQHQYKEARSCERGGRAER